LNKFTLIISPKAAKDLDGLNGVICMKIAEAIKILEENPFPRGKLIRKIKGKHSDFYRLRVDKYRVFFMIETDKVGSLFFLCLSVLIAVDLQTGKNQQAPAE